MENIASAAVVAEVGEASLLLLMLNVIIDQ